MQYVKILCIILINKEVSYEISRNERGGATPLSRHSSGLDSFKNKNYKPSMKNYSVRLGFTLAEVLITLGIIGIVAALTIPTVVSKYQKRSTVTQLQKVYSVLNQAYLFSKVEGGDNVLLNNVNAGYDMDAETSQEKISEYMENYFLPYLKVQKNCGISYDTKCFGFQHNNINNDSTGMSWNKYNVILQDGTFISAVYNTLCDENGVCANGGGILLFVDLNGAKGPNVAGKDYFMFYVKPKSSNINFYEASSTDTNNKRNVLLNDCNTSKWRRSCGALIKYDGWKISDDYLW